MKLFLFLSRLNDQQVKLKGKKKGEAKHSFGELKINICILKRFHICFGSALHQAKQHKVLLTFHVYIRD